MSESRNLEYIFSSLTDNAVSIVLSIYAYLYGSIELIEKYKYVLSNEIQLLTLSTIILFYIILFTLKQVWNQIINNENKKGLSSKGFSILIILFILSCLFFYYCYSSLSAAFNLRHDPLFDYFFGNYIRYMIIYYGGSYVIVSVISKFAKPFMKTYGI